MSVTGKPANLSTPRGGNRCSCGLAVLAFPKIDPGTVQYGCEIADLERLPSTFIHVNEPAFQIENLDAIAAAGKQTVFKFFAGEQGFRSRIRAARYFIQVARIENSAAMQGLQAFLLVWW
jgi:hypothetical protein